MELQVYQCDNCILLYQHYALSLQLQRRWDFDKVFGMNFSSVTDRTLVVASHYIRNCLTETVLMRGLTFALSRIHGKYKKKLSPNIKSSFYLELNGTEFTDHNCIPEHKHSTLAQCECEYLEILNMAECS